MLNSKSSAIAILRLMRGNFSTLKLPRNFHISSRVLRLPRMVSTLALTLFLSWVQVSSDTYVVKSSAGEEKARRVLKELEDFHQLLGTFEFRNTRLPELPIEVLIIGDEPTLKELAPEYNGRKVSVAGYYQRG